MSKLAYSNRPAFDHIPDASQRRPTALAQAGNRDKRIADASIRKQT